MSAVTDALCGPSQCSRRRQQCRHPSRRRSLVCAASGDGAVLLEVRDLRAKVAGSDKQILQGVSLTIRAGEVHAIMGKNGSGKSTLSKVLVGHPDYEVTGGTVQFKGQDLLALAPEARSHQGLFLSFQSPVEIPGVRYARARLAASERRHPAAAGPCCVAHPLTRLLPPTHARASSNTDFLRLACNARRKARGLAEMDPLEFYAFLSPKVSSRSRLLCPSLRCNSRAPVLPQIDELKMDMRYLTRNVNEGFSGGEKKRNEILQLAVLEAEMAILDEIDSGLDIDALRDVSAAVNSLRRSDRGLLMITHYQRLLDYITPDFVHIMIDGRIVQSGGKELALQLEKTGYAGVAA